MISYKSSYEFFKTSLSCPILIIVTSMQYILRDYIMYLFDSKWVFSRKFYLYINYFSVSSILFTKILFLAISNNFEAISYSSVINLQIAEECLLPFGSTYRYCLRRIVCPYLLLSFMYKINRRRVNGRVSAERHDASLSVSQNRSYRCGERARRAKASVKITRPFQPPPAPTPHPSTRTSPSHTLCPPPLPTRPASTCFYLRSVHFAARTAAVYRRSTQRDRA